MVFNEYFNDYRVVFFFNILNKIVFTEEKLPNAEMLTNFTRFLYEINKYQEWQINTILLS